MDEPSDSDANTESRTKYPLRLSSLAVAKQVESPILPDTVAASQQDVSQAPCNGDLPEENHCQPHTRAQVEIKISSQEKQANDLSHGSHSPPKALPPLPVPEPEITFDFHRFLEQLRHRSADPVARYLRSFLKEFGKRQWMADEQVKFIRDFLSFIAGKMALCEVWQNITETEYENAREGMEKLVMNRLYAQTFSPAIGMNESSTMLGNTEKILPNPGRRSQHEDDLERDELLSQKIKIYGWIQPIHLEMTPIIGNGMRLLKLAQQELLKLKTYRAPRDKIICILNCCKVIFGMSQVNALNVFRLMILGFLRSSDNPDTSADAFVPLLIFVVLQSNPDHLISNMQYILRFRDQDKLGGESGYYLSSLMGVVEFIERLDRKTLKISDEDFERNVETAISAIGNESQAVMPMPYMESSPASIKTHELQSRTRSNQPKNLGSSETTPAVQGLLRNIQKPLAGLGKIFSEDPQLPAPALTHGETQEETIDIALQLRSIADTRHLQPLQPPPVTSRRIDGDVMAVNTDFRALTVQGTTANIPRAQETHATGGEEYQDVVEYEILRSNLYELWLIGECRTLASMFPSLDKDIISDVVRVKNGRIGSAVDACLALHT